MPDFRYYDVFVPRGYGRKVERLLENLRGTDVVAGPVKDGIAEMVRIMSDLLAPEIERVLNRDLGKDMATVAESEYVEEVEARRSLSGAEAISKDLRKELERMADGMSDISIGSINLAGIVQRGIDEASRSDEVQFWLGDMAKWLREFQGELENLGRMFSDIRWAYEQITNAEEDEAVRKRYK
jgi:hypothetical protein